MWVNKATGETYDKSGAKVRARALGALATGAAVDVQFQIDVAKLVQLSGSGGGSDDGKIAAMAKTVVRDAKAAIAKPSFKSDLTAAIAAKAKAQAAAMAAGGGGGGGGDLAGFSPGIGDVGEPREGERSASTGLIVLADVGGGGGGDGHTALYIAGSVGGVAVLAVAFWLGTRCGKHGGACSVAPEKNAAAADASKGAVSKAAVEAELQK
jgi:hypothetical protein